MKNNLSTALFALMLMCGSAARAGTVELTQNGAWYSVPITTLKEARFKQTVRQQEDFSCGSAALATLLTYHYNRPVSERVVLEAMFARGNQVKIKREGFSLLDMKTYLESIGYTANGFQAPLEKLADTTTPAIVLVRENGYNHFVVVKGLNERKVLVGDPAIGTRVLPREQFSQLWTNGIVFVIHGKGVKGSFNASADWAIRPSAPLGEAIARESLANITVSRFGSGDF
jgi:hypothetical protein